MIYSEATNNNFFVRKIVVNEVEITVEFRFYKALPATADEPESPEEVIIESVWVDDRDITNLIGQKNWEAIEQEILKLYDHKEGVC